MAPAAEAEYQPKDRRAAPIAGVTIPVGWFLVIVTGMFATVGSGAWYMADQAAEIRSLKILVAKEEAEASLSRKAFDESMSGLRASVNAIGDRTTRIESQLIYISDQVKGKK